MTAAELLDLASAGTHHHLEAGTVILRQGEPHSGLYVLAEGVLDVRRQGRSIQRHTEAGSIVGEISLLLDTAVTADVVATEPTVVYRLDDADRLFAELPAFGRHLAVTLARRLDRIVGYLDDLHRQFDDREGTLGLVPTVLEDILRAERPDPDPGSERETESPY